MIQLKTRQILDALEDWKNARERVIELGLEAKPEHWTELGRAEHALMDLARYPYEAEIVVSHHPGLVRIYHEEELIYDKDKV